MDWWTPTIVSGLIGFILAMIVSWAFYRAQQQQQFEKIYDKSEKLLYDQENFTQRMYTDIRKCFDTNDDKIDRTLQTQKVYNEQIFERLQKVFENSNDRLSYIAQEIASLKTIEGVSQNIKLANEINMLHRQFEILNNNIKNVIKKH